MICPRCGRRLVVIDSRVVADFRIRYIGCRKQRGGCGYRPPNNIKASPLADDGMTEPTNSANGMKQLFDTPPANDKTRAGGTHMFVQHPTERRAFDINELAVAYGLSPARIARMVAENQFPPPAIRSGNTRRWLASQLDAWEQAAGRVQCGEPLGE